ncbi:MAG: hypothetical protein KBT52_05565, partial [Paraperlucidibaca sp.]|nr:hypothetical protein [Paraperlucidibaca sp.]
MKKMVMIGVGVAVLLAAAVGGTLFVTGAFGGHTAASATEAAPVPVKATAAYLPMDPAFTVNIEDGFATRFLQVEINLMYRDSSVVDRATKA